MTTSGHNVGLEEEKPMNDTPRTDAAWETTPSVYDFIVEMKRIERELNAANQRIKRLEEELGEANAEINRLTQKVGQLYEGAEEQKHHIKLLEEAGHELLYDNDDMSNINRWHNAKKNKL